MHTAVYGKVLEHVNLRKKYRIETTEMNVLRDISGDTRKGRVKTKELENKLE